MSDAYDRLVQTLQRAPWWKQEIHVGVEDLRAVLREVLESRTQQPSATELTPDEIHHLMSVRNTHHKADVVKSVRARTGKKLSECYSIVNRYLEEHT